MDKKEDRAAGGEKSGVRLCIHRAADAIGGNCIEITASGGERLLLDAGRPLDALEGEITPVPATLDLTTPVAGVLLSHSHTDHCGMLEALPAGWPVYCGEATENLLRLSAAVGQRPLAQTCTHWENGKATATGPFTVTPHRIDHSAFDAYALQINVEGKTIMYSGDFRAHGRKAKLTEDLMRNPPEQVDVLIMEGTNLPAEGSRRSIPDDMAYNDDMMYIMRPRKWVLTQEFVDSWLGGMLEDSRPKSSVAETELEKEFTNLFRECPGRVFVSWSSTNIDRAVTLYNACKNSGRVLVPDLYCMVVLMRLGEFDKNIPQPEWEGGHMRAVVTNKMKFVVERPGEPNLVEYLKRHSAAMSAKALAANPERWVIMARGSLLADYAAKGVIPNERDAWVCSMLDGYLKRESSQAMREFFAPCRYKYIHSSGHASQEALHRFAESMQAKMLIPVHGEAWEAHKENFPNIHILPNETWIKL
jgi:ribonuclease J